MELLVAALFAAFWLYLYDTTITGPAWARVLLAGVLGHLGMVSMRQELLLEATDVARAAGAGFAAMLVVALLQWLQVARDVAMTSVLRRR